MNNRTSKSKFPLTFFLLVLIISIPFWLIGTLTERFLPKEIPINLPISALMGFNPLIAAVILTYRGNGSEGVKKLLKRSFDYKRIKKKIWYGPIFFLMPIMMVLEYLLMYLTGVSISNPQFPVLIAPILFIIFFIFAVGEEIGWTGYAFDPLQTRWNALGASIILGIVWAVWHIVPYSQTHNTPTWILWQCIATVGLRVLIVWLYNNSGKSIFAAITFHATINVSTFMYPNYGSHYDPFIASIVITVAVVVVTFLWGPKTLARYRYTRLSKDVQSSATN